MSSFQYKQQNFPTLESVMSRPGIEKNQDSLKLIFSLLDLTTLNTEDTAEKVSGMCNKINDFHIYFPGYPNLGAICIYPQLVPVVKENLSVKKVKIASVAGGFPSSQTFIEVKEMESKMAVDAGADEIDIVISAGKYLENELDYVADEIRCVKKAIGHAKLKVILETGLLSGPESIFQASMICMEAGADFIKTSTGKVNPAATPEAVLVMCQAIRIYTEKTGLKTGIKPAGGISTPDQALLYLNIVKSMLGEEWLDPKLFRIGASRLANNLLSEISSLETGKLQEITYF